MRTLFWRVQWRQRQWRFLGWHLEQTIDETEKPDDFARWQKSNGRLWYHVLSRANVVWWRFQFLLQIVWDPENKRWINTDQDAAEEESFKPPPKMADLTRSTMPAAAPPGPSAGPTMPPPAATPIDPIPQSNVHAYGHPAPHADAAANNNNIDQQQAAKVPNLQSNMFKMQRNKSESRAITSPRDLFNCWLIRLLQRSRNHT